MSPRLRAPLMRPFATLVRPIAEARVVAWGLTVPVTIYARGACAMSRGSAFDGRARAGTRSPRRTCWDPVSGPGYRRLCEGGSTAWGLPAVATTLRGKRWLPGMCGTTSSRAGAPGRPPVARRDSPPHVGLSNQGRPLAATTVRERLRYYARLTGLAGQRVNQHRLWATFAVGLDQQGVNVTVIEELLGHADIKTTAHTWRWLAGESGPRSAPSSARSKTTEDQVIGAPRDAASRPMWYHGTTR